MFFNKLWLSNVEFQFGFIYHCVKNQLIPKLLSAGPGGLGAGQELSQPVPQLDSLKCQPNDLETNPELSTWKYQKLYQILIDMCTSPALTSSSFGDVLHMRVSELFKWPLHNCPDLLTLGVLGCTPGEADIKRSILMGTTVSFLQNHANAAVILHAIWSVSEPTANGTSPNQWARQVLLQAMSEYYMANVSEHNEQQQKLSRILDVAQDLKALHLLLNSTNYPFVIDLACLASRREYLKLDKWLMDKIQSNGEPFIAAAVQFLNKRCAALMMGAKAFESGAPPITNLPSETMAMMLHCMHSFVTSANASASGPTISKDLSETILTMVANSALLLQKVPRQPPPGQLAGAVNSTVNTAKAGQPASANTPIGDLGLGSLSLTLANSAASTFGVTPRANTFAGPAQSSQLPLANTAGTQPQARAAASGQGADLANIFPEMKQNVSPEIEKEADSYFQRIYNTSGTSSMTIDEVLEMLRRFQDSSSAREKEVFACMIRNLFKEYLYFPQYPDKELLITAQLFGGIIQMGLVKYMALVVALRYVLEALRKPFNSKMYFFGIAALDRFKTKLKDYPLYCQHLASIPHFREFPPHLIDYIEYGSQSQEPPARRGDVTTPPSAASSGSTPSSGFTTPAVAASIAAAAVGNLNTLPPPPPTSSSSSANQPASKPTVPVPSAASSVNSVSGTRPSIANATNIDTLLAAGETYQTPPEHMQDKVAFIVNNLSMINLAQKTEEFKELIGKDDTYYGWIAQYFVQKRAAIEQNFHTLYLNFLDTLKNGEISNLTVRETYRNIKVLLNSEKCVTNFSDRSLLKNLGHWLGMITLTKNKPILAVDLNVKNLLIEAYHKGAQDLIYIVPFIAKILDACAKSRVFKVCGAIRTAQSLSNSALFL